MNYIVAILTIGLLFACSNDHRVASVEQDLCRCDAEIPPCCCTSPILIDIAGDGFRLTSWTDGVEFAPRPGFHPSARAWTEVNSDDAWLVLDRDGDGVINDGSEMFGDATPQTRPAGGTLRNGFLALAQHDDDSNDAIDETDAVFSELRLWQDADHDGVSQPSELHTLPDLGVAGISLAYAEAREVDQHGNAFRYWARVYGTAGSPVGMTAWDVWLVGVRPELVGESSRVVFAGDKDELRRCLAAADGDLDTWLDYCNTLQWPTRASCRRAGHTRTERRGWCFNYWGTVITCEA
jgi:hypothetical protein